MSRKNHIPNLIKKCMLILVAIQVVLGGMWLVCNLNHVPDFQETRDMLKASETLVFDEYMGVLYPVVLRLFSVFGDAFYVPVYALQVVIAGWSYYCLVRSVAGDVFVKNGKEYLWLSVGYLITFPMILQCHMSILPYSLASSLLVFLLVQIGCLMRDRERLQKKRILLIGVLWLVVGLLIPDYGIISAFLIMGGLICIAWKQKKKLLLYLFMVIVTMTTLFTTLSLAQTQGSYGRMQRTVNSVLLTRFSWPNFARDGFYWTYKGLVEFKDEDLDWLCMYPEYAVYIFGPKVEGTVGKEQANIIYGEMAKLSFSVGKKDALKALGRDALANAGGPFALQYQMSGRGVAYTGWNYYQMQGNVPGLTKYFVKFALYSFLFLFVMTIGICWSRRKHWKLFEVVRKAVPALSGLGVMILWYTMIGNGMQDYLKVLPVMLFWCLLPMLGLGILVRKTAD